MISTILNLRMKTDIILMMNLLRVQKVSVQEVRKKKIIGADMMLIVTASW